MNRIAGVAPFWVLALVLLASPALRAAQSKTEDAQKQAEAKRAAEEEEAENKLDNEDPKKNPVLSGKVLLIEPQDGEKPEVIGLFVVGDHQYELKVSNDKLREDLKPFNGKSVALGGKIRNDGKYFIASRIIAGNGPPPVQLRNPEGL